jgi:hypothetical protein
MEPSKEGCCSSPFPYGCIQSVDKSVCAQAQAQSLKTAIHYNYLLSIITTTAMSCQFDLYVTRNDGKKLALSAHCSIIAKLEASVINKDIATEYSAQ